MFKLILGFISSTRTVLDCLYVSILFLEAFLQGMSLEEAEDQLHHIIQTEDELAEAKIILWWSPNSRARLDARWEADRARERRLAAFRGE